ncbi:HAD-IA family hydrolase [Candidatus Saccharibacteria bacterium]|nr:HAD-IA family hydrolase [Candidatus Saccharibacteria bacterium]
MDGVLVDSSRSRPVFKKLLFEKAGYSEIDDDLLEDASTPIQQIITEVLARKNITSRDAIDKIFKMVEDGDFRDDIKHLYKFPDGLIEVLEQLKKHYKLGVVTSREAMGVDEIFKIKDFRNYFEVIVKYNDSSNHKPHPEPLLIACEKLFVQPENTVYIGDMESDLMAAYNANMHFVHYSSEEFNPLKHKVQYFSQLPDAIKSI